MTSENNTQPHSGPNLVDEFETTFQECFEALIGQEQFNVQDCGDRKTDVENNMMRFLDKAKQLECFFLQKRLRFSSQKPDLVVKEIINNKGDNTEPCGKEDVMELRIELMRKDQLLQKLGQRVQTWKDILAGTQPRLQHQQPPPLQHPPQGAQSLPPRQAVPPVSAHNPMQQGATGMPIGPPIHGTPGLSGGPTMQGAPVMSTIPSMQTTMPGPGSMQHPSMGQHTVGAGYQPHYPHGQMYGGSQMPMQQLNGPLAYLEQTAANVGMPERR